MAKKNIKENNCTGVLCQYYIFFLLLFFYFKVRTSLTAVVPRVELMWRPRWQEGRVTVVLPADEPCPALVAVVAVAIALGAGELLRAAVVVAQAGWSARVLQNVTAVENCKFSPDRVTF